MSLYVLDFDGVICDSAVETAITGWKVAQQLWDDMPKELPHHTQIQQFRHVRPYLETGYEAILIMRWIEQKKDTATLCQNYHLLMQQTLEDNQLQINELKKLFGQARDQWIAKNRDEWLSMNPLFDGIANALKRLENKIWYIITTKQQRFVSQILQANNISLDKAYIYGMEKQQSKQQSLQAIQKQQANNKIIFIEDRLATLTAIQENPTLNDITLQLVSWGYNTEEDKKLARQRGIEVIAELFVEIV